MVFDNNKTLDGNEFLQNQVYDILFDDKNNKQIKHMHIIFISNFFINKMRNINYIYVDGTFICPNNFSQIIIILRFAHIINRKYLLSYILINNKTQIGYELALKNFKI